ncbi:VC_2705 family sodium/solute symporter [Pelomonas sp. UHG3]|uniref:VC_2705 family sodium/solute symporter n=1 Tax=Roseateles hydrophilus TaxID=2975054 RepID=A0ACC6CDR2_9BURK|nr:VC_2705 family sodium/solute symporter [Pelomonas sp. UHG3]MCY4746489.1 VC_2705 family sodium/solute symporter [Pelomonas sp. UHG3]
MLANRLHRRYAVFALSFIALVVALGVAEQRGMPKAWIGYTFLGATVAVYAVIGILGRTTDPAEYFVAGRRVPPLYNGMAAAADWMSAASFIGLVGTLYASGYSGLAYVLGWTGGFVLVALCIAPYLRRFGQFTLGDFLGERFDSRALRLLGAAAAILVSFVYLVAQIYGVGLITTRLTGLAFEVGVFVGLGGVLVCSFLGGMRAVTWTQVAQYLIMILAYLVPVIWLSVKQTGWPLPQLVYGQQLHQLAERERELIHDPAELQVRALHQQRADAAAARLQDVPAALAKAQAEAAARVAALKAEGAPLAAIQAAEKQRAAMPRTPAEAEEQWRREQASETQRARPLSGLVPHSQPFPEASPRGNAEDAAPGSDSRRNFIALALCLMVGTAGLPHLLTRYYTTTSVATARESVAWSLVFICLLYLTAPALAVMVKTEVFNGLVGTAFDQLPAWIRQWQRVDPALLSAVDLNGDGRLQLGELRLHPDLVMLVLPELGGLPYVISGMVAAGGLAAALSTADGLLLAISSALSHDIYFKSINPDASRTRRVTLSKALLLAAALTAAAVASSRPADILAVVTAAFSIAGSTFFPALVAGVFWRRANRVGALAGMLSGLAVCLAYLAMAHPDLRSLFGLAGPASLLWGIPPAAAAVFGVPAGALVLVLASLMTAPPGPREREIVETLRTPPPR